MTFSLKKLLQGNLGGVFNNKSFQGVQSPANTRGYTRTLNKALLWADTGSDISLTGGKWGRIGEYSIPAQNRVHLGFGVSGGNPEEMGRIHMDILDDTATNSVEEKGYIKIGYTDYNESIICVIWEGRSEELSDSSTTVGISRSDEVLLPETSPEMKGHNPVLAGEDSKLFIDMKLDATDIIVETGIGTGAINTWKLPITVYAQV